MKYTEQVIGRIGTSGLPMTRAWAAYDAWEHTPCFVSGNLVAVGLNNGPEIHIVFMVDRVPSMRHVLNTTALPVLQAYGHMTTTVPEDDEASATFVQRVGFRRVGACPIGYTYRLDEADWRF